MRFDSILVPLDGTPTGAAALPYAEALALRTGAKLTLMRAARAPLVIGGDARVVQRQVIDDAQDYLETVGNGLAARGAQIEIALPYGSAAAWIPEEVGLRHVDLVVMATHDRAGLDRWFHGSVSESA